MATRKASQPPGCKEARSKHLASLVATAVKHLAKDSWYAGRSRAALERTARASLLHQFPGLSVTSPVPMAPKVEDLRNMQADPREQAKAEQVEARLNRLEANLRRVPFRNDFFFLVAQDPETMLALVEQFLILYRSRHEDTILRYLREAIERTLAARKRKPKRAQGGRPPFWEDKELLARMKTEARMYLVDRKPLREVVVSTRRGQGGSNKNHVKMAWEDLEKLAGAVTQQNVFPSTCHLVDRFGFDLREDALLIQRLFQYARRSRRTPIS